MIGPGGLELLQILADGRWHSGETLAGQLGVSRAAVWKRLQGLQTLPGVTVEAVPGQGYRLAQPLELFERELILAGLAPSRRDRLQALEIHPVIDSTSSALQRAPAPDLHHGRACLAEYQSAGRGRRGRSWVGGFGRNLMLSLAWRFDLELAGLAGLSLAAGVALAEVLEEAGLEGHRLKWPNDLLVDGAKLGGILVEAQGEADGPCTAVIGVGLNLALEDEGAAIDQPWTDLRRHLSPMPGRNRLAGRLLDRLMATCERLQRDGLQPFLEPWRQRDGFRDRPVVLHTPRGASQGICRGIDDQGALLIETAAGIERHHAGEVTLRGDS